MFGSYHLHLVSKLLPQHPPDDHWFTKLSSVHVDHSSICKTTAGVEEKKILGVNDPWLLHSNLDSSLVPQQLTISLKFCPFYQRISQLFQSKSFLVDLEMSDKTMLSNRHQLHRKLQICLQKFNEFPEKNFPGQGLVFKVALLTSFSMFSSNPLNLTLIFLVADSYLFYAPSTSLSQASQALVFYWVELNISSLFEINL